MKDGGFAHASVCHWSHRRPRLRNAACGHRPSGSPRRFMAMVITASFHGSSSSLGRRACPSISAMDSTAGRPCIGSTPPASIGSRWSAAPPVAPVPCHCRSRRAVQGDRRGDRPPAEHSGRLESPEEAAEHFGWFTMFAGMDAPTSSERTRSLLGWRPELLGLIAEIDHPAYFD